MGFAAHPQRGHRSAPRPPSLKGMEAAWGGVGGGVGGGLGLLCFPRHPALRRVTAPSRCSLNNQSTTRRRPALCRGMRALCHPPEIRPRPSRRLSAQGAGSATNASSFFFFKSSTFCRVTPPRCRPPRPRRAAVATPRPRGPLGSQSPAGETVAESLVRGAPHRGIPMPTRVGPGTGDASPPRAPGPAGNETETLFPPPRNWHRSPERNAGT